MEERQEEVTELVGVGSPKEAGTKQGVKHCTGLLRQVTFPAHIEQGKAGQGIG